MKFFEEVNPIGRVECPRRCEHSRHVDVDWTRNIIAEVGWRWRMKPEILGVYFGAAVGQNLVSEEIY